MKIKLKKIKYDCYDDVLNKITSDFINSKSININSDYIENNSESVLIDGKEIICEFDLQKYEDISSSIKTNYLKEAEIAMMLHKDFVDCNGVKIPKNIYYQKEVWAYLSLMPFRIVVANLKLNSESKYNEDVISRVYFSDAAFSKIDRTCLMFYWIFVDILNSENDPEITKLAFEYIDPVKAVFEREMSKNTGLLRAFVEAISKAKNPWLLKNNKYRSFVPSNLSCYYAVNTYDNSTYSEIVENIVEQMNEILV